MSICAKPMSFTHVKDVSGRCDNVLDTFITYVQPMCLPKLLLVWDRYKFVYVYTLVPYILKICLILVSNKVAPIWTRF